MAAAAGTLPWSGLPRSCRPGGHGSPALHPVENAAATVSLLARRMPGRDSIRQDEPHAANSRSIPRGISVSPARGLSPAWDALCASRRRGVRRCSTCVVPERAWQWKAGREEVRGLRSGVLTGRCFCGFPGIGESEGAVRGRRSRGSAGRAGARRHGPSTEGRNRS